MREQTVIRPPRRSWLLKGEYWLGRIRAGARTGLYSLALPEPPEF
jgi:hypothetical protein